jgi:hypothetical protein
MPKWHTKGAGVPLKSCGAMCVANLQATFSLVLHRPQSFSLLEDIGKLFAR